MTNPKFDEYKQNFVVYANMGNQQCLTDISTFFLQLKTFSSTSPKKRFHLVVSTLKTQSGFQYLKLCPNPKDQSVSAIERCTPVQIEAYLYINVWDLPRLLQVRQIEATSAKSFHQKLFYSSWCTHSSVLECHWGGSWANQLKQMIYLEERHCLPKTIS